MKYRILLIVLLVYNIINAKSTEIKGEIFESGSQTKIPFVSLYIKDKNGNQNLGVMSNEKGTFLLKIDDTYLEAEVTFSHVNYKVRTIKILDLLKNSRIELTINNFMLNEVKVTSIPINKFLETVIENSSEHFEKNIVLNSYAREITKIDGQYENISDALIDYYISKKNGKSKLVVNQSRAFLKDPENLKKSLSAYNVQKFIKNSYDFRLIKTVLNKDNYEHQIFDQTEDGKEYTYIKIIPNENVTELLYDGFIKIDTETNLIAETKIYTSQKHMQYAKYINMIFFDLRFENSMEWTKFETVNGKYILVYNKDSLEFSAKMKKEGEHKYNASCDIFIQGFKENIPVPGQTYENKSIFEAGTNYKDEYWKQVKSYPLTEEEFNYIKSFQKQ